MKLRKLILLTILFVIMLSGCQTNTRSDFDDDTETWEMMPFYGELRFLIVREDTGAPIPDVILEVSGLPIRELQNVSVTRSDIRSEEDGRIVIHQTMRGITYWGEGPPPPTFTFSAPGYHTQAYSVEDLASGTSYDPYSDDNLPTTTFLYAEGEEMELPTYEFTIRLVPSN